MTGLVTTEMVAAAAARALDQGIDLRRHTTNYVAQHLVVYDKECKGCDYASAVSAVSLWQYEQRVEAS